ncbi:hypothetical protein BDB01DRAFT_775725 [Pilobolus umbonatus]|nr:hypothetical protein BDB01DRAFT_775725 [Pilobolus umbonatus]
MSQATQSIADLTTVLKQTTGDVPPPLVGASSTTAGNKLYVFGGRLVSSRQMTNHLYILNLDTLVWIHHVPEPHSSSAPRPRYFHSANLYGHYLLIFGGMSYSVQRSSQNLCALDDICLLDLKSMTWKYPEIQPSIYSPQARYAHLAECSSDKLVIMGGQDMSNQYINEINVFDLITYTWIHVGTLSKQYGAYRAIAFCPSRINTKLQSSEPFWENPENPKDDLSVCVYSNYNFTDVTRDLQSFSPLSSSEFRDHSAEMSGTTLPPGLRFPSGDLLGHHMILTGTYLTPTHRAFHIWALNLANLAWTRIDTGTMIMQGSWNRGILYGDKNQFIVFGDRERDLLEDYNHRQVNFGQIAVVELEAFGIYSYPKETCVPVAQELGLSMLNEPSISDIEIVTNDNRSIPANTAVLALRWPYFAQMSEGRIYSAGFKRLYFNESYAVVLALLQFAYTDHLMTAQQHHPNILSRLLILSDMYNLPRLGTLATHALHQLLTVSTASLVYEASALTGKTSLQIRALRVIINAKKMAQQQHQQQQLQQQQNQGYQHQQHPQSPPQQPRHTYNEHYYQQPTSPISETSAYSSHYSIIKQDDADESYNLRNNYNYPSTRRITSSKSSTLNSQEVNNVSIPSPKLSKSSTTYYPLSKSPPFVDRPRKASLVPNSPPYNFKSGYMSSGYERSNYGNRF